MKKLKHGKKKWNKEMKRVIGRLYDVAADSRLDECCRESAVLMAAVAQCVKAGREPQAMVAMMLAEFKSLTGVEYMASIIPKEMFDSINSAIAMANANPVSKH